MRNNEDRPPGHSPKRQLSSRFRAPHPALRTTDHRPWPLPPGPWLMAQTWYDLLFAHWPVPPESLRPAIPDALTIDTFDGRAWVGVVPFGMKGIHPRRLPLDVPWLSAFLELNVRTYVTLGGRPGVFFYSLDAANPLAVAAARRWYHLPYFYARMRLRRDGDALDYSSRRVHPNAPPAAFRGRYRPTGEVFRSAPGSLEHWLTERYCLYAVDRRGRVYRGEIHHAPWPLQPAEAEFRRNTMARPHGIALPGGPPVLQFARRLDVVVWPARRVTSDE